MRNTKLTVDVAKNIFRTMELFHLSECYSKNNKIGFKLDGEIYTISDLHNVDISGRKREVYEKLKKSYLYGQSLI